MIWQLVRRDRAWQTAPVITSVIVLDVARRNDPSMVTSVIGSVIGIFIFLLMMGRIYERADLFTAALPVSAQQILLARLVAILSVWIPIGATVAIVWVLRRSSGVAASLVEVGVDVTALSILILCARPRQFRAPLPWVAAVIAVAILFSITTTALRWGRTAELAVPAIAVAAVFLYTWKNLPPSFQSAPERPAGRPLAAQRILTANGMWWLPVCLSLFPVSVLLPMFAFTQPPIGQWIFGGLSGFFIAGGSIAIQRSFRWIHTLPIRPRSTMLLILAVYLVPFMLSVLLSPFYWPADFGIHLDRLWLVNTAAVLCWTLLGINSLLGPAPLALSTSEPLPEVDARCTIDHTSGHPLDLRFYSLAKSAIPVDVLVHAAPVQLSYFMSAPLWQLMSLIAIPAVFLCWTACTIFEGVEITAWSRARV